MRTAWLALAFCLGAAACGEQKVAGSSGERSSSGSVVGSATPGGGEGGPDAAPTGTTTATPPPTAIGNSPSPSCSGGLALCPEGCKDLQNDKLNCGSCNHACALHCQAGSCIDPCPTGLKSCRGICVDVSTNLTHCGDCNQPCGSGQICSGGTCTCGAAVAFSQVQAIFDASCVSCHSGASPAAKLSLEAGKSYAQLVNVGSTTCPIPDRKRVFPGDALASNLYNRVSGRYLCGGSQEPPNGPPISAAAQDQIRAWICNGAPP